MAAFTVSRFGLHPVFDKNGYLKLGRNFEQSVNKYDITVQTKP